MAREQLKVLKARVDADVERLIAFQTEHGLLNTPQTLPSGVSGDTAHNSTLDEIDQLGRDLAAASTDRILREAEYHAASQGDPELVWASDSALQAENGGLDANLLEQIHARRSDLDLEKAQLSAEHGPNFPRVVEIGHQLRTWTGRRPPKTPHSWCNSAAGGKPQPTANRWCGRILKD